MKEGVEKEEIFNNFKSNSIFIVNCNWKKSYSKEYILRFRHEEDKRVTQKNTKQQGTQQSVKTHLGKSKRKDISSSRGKQNKTEVR